MQYLRTTDLSIRWCVGPFRESYAQSDYENARDKAEKHKCTLALATQLPKAWCYALAQPHPKHRISDFGAALSQFVQRRGLNNLIYIEDIGDNNVLCVAITQDGIFDSIHNREQLVSVIKRYQRSQKEPFNFLVAEKETVPGESSKTNTLISTDLESFENLHVEVTHALTLELFPGDFVFKDIDDALQLKSPVWFWPITAAVLASLVALAFVYMTPEPEPLPVNPHLQRAEITTRMSISPLARGNQIIEVMQQLKAVVGWNLVSVNQGASSLAFKMSPNSGALVSELELFAKRFGFDLLTEPNAKDKSVLLIKPPLNKVNTEDSRLFNADEVVTFIRDAAALYVPGTTITMIRATPDASREWGTIELLIELQETNYRALNTLGAILIGLPVSLGGGPTELAVGDLTVAGENLSGSIKLVVYGERQNWQ
jgi:hypothetical protein